jgi:carbon monoxide dehydrogenase subunit G
MKLEQSFEVAAPLQRVWEALIDVERVAPCLPGAAVTGRNDDGSYNGTFKVKIGPTSAAYSGKLSMQDLDAEAHSATMDAQGTDKRGQGGAKATIMSKLFAAGDQATRVEVVTDYHITGRLARFGRGGMIEDISNRLLGEFANCLQTSLAGEPEVAEDAVPAPAPAPVPGPAAEVEVEVEPSAAPEPAPASEEPTSANGSTEAAEAAEAAGEAGAAGAAGGAPSSPPPLTPPPSSPPPSSPPAWQPPVPESEPIHGLTLVASVLWSRAKGNPAPAAAVVFGFLLALRVFRRRG